MNSLALAVSRKHLWTNMNCALLLLVASVPAMAGDSKLTVTQREMIIHNFLAEHPYVHRALPRGKAGVRIDGDKITPSEAELNQIVAQSGASARPGEHVRITGVRFEHNGVLFEINGGPMKRKSWRERVSVGVNGVDPRASQAEQTDSNVYNNSTGSSVFLELKDNAEVTTDRIKDLLAPVLDFKAQSPAEAYQKTLPPKLAAAVKNHHALVGMDKEMVLYAMGRPPRRVRETKDGREVEEWIYGAPPQDVEFIRFINDKAVSIEEMKVSGEKRVRNTDEVGDAGGTLNASSKPARPSGDAEEERRAAPTLLRPGEKAEAPDASARDRNPNPMPDSLPPSDPGNGPSSTPSQGGRMPPSGGNGPNQML